MSSLQFRSGLKTHTERPRRISSAQIAWDILSQDGTLRDMKLVDGLWMCERVDGGVDDVEATFVRCKLLGAREKGRP